MITADMKAADVYERFPATRPVFEKFGFHALAHPGMRRTFGRITTLENACRLQGVDLEDFLDDLNGAAEKEL